MAQGGSVRGDDPRFLRVLLRLSKERTSEPTAAIVDSRTLRSTPESGSRGGYDGHKNKKGSKVHAAVDTLGDLLAVRVGPANEDDRKELEKLSEEIQKATGENVELAYVDQGYTGEKASESAAEHGTSDSKWSSMRRPRATSYSYQGDGWWSEISHGHRAFGDW
jgi:transposase